MGISPPPPRPCSGQLNCLLLGLFDLLGVVQNRTSNSRLFPFGDLLATNQNGCIEKPRIRVEDQTVLQLVWPAPRLLVLRPSVL